MRVILAGGGTGGHVIPAIAIAQQLRESYGVEVVFVGTSRGIETRLVPAAGFDLHLIDVGQLNRVSLATRLATLAGLPLAVIQVWRMMAEYRPDVVVGVGGYASGPAMLAAGLRGTPSLIFEPNVIPGFANRMVAFMAGAAAVQFPQAERWFRNSRVTGVPVRQEFFDVPSRPPANPPTLLLFGGSQGARALNRVMVESLPELLRRIPGLRIVHQTGERQYEEVAAEYLEMNVAAEVSPFISTMATAFAQADLLVCRSGASTVAEVAAAGKPAVFIPLPTAADNHQLRNAESLVRQNAAVLIEEAQLTPQTFVAAVAGLLSDPSRLQTLGANARRLAHADAAKQIARMAARLGGFAHSSVSG